MFEGFAKDILKPRGLVRLGVTLICICISVYQLAECFRKLRYPPISSHYGFIFNQSLKYPTVTFCRQPGYKSTILQKYGLPHKELTYSTTWRSFKFSNYTLDEFFTEATYNFSETFVVAGLDGWESNVSVSSFVALAHGKCHAISPKSQSFVWGGDFGYFFYLTYYETDRSVDPDLRGYRVFIHDESIRFTEKAQDADSFLEHLFIEPGDSLEIKLDVNEYRMLPNRQRVCVADVSYSSTKCIEECVNALVTQDVGCSVPWLPNEKLHMCNNSKDVIDVIDFSSPRSSFMKNYMKSCNCPASCNATNYVPVVRSRKRDDSADILLTLYYATNVHTVMAEVPGYDWNQFLSDLGGSLGFLLGLSVVGAISLAERFVAATMAGIGRWNEKLIDEEEGCGRDRAASCENVPTIMKPDGGFVVIK